MLLCETFPVGAFQCNCTILACGDTKDAVVIDPGGDYPRIKQVIEHYDLTVKAIIHTHAHLDHIHCTRDVKQAHGGDIALHPADLPLYTGIEMQGAMFGWKVEPTLPVDRELAHNDRIEFGKAGALVLHTPGHTPGSVCFEVHDGRDTIVFSGDTLFMRGIGRTDLPGGDARQILTSIKDVLYARAPDARVIPGHGPATTIEQEAAQNPFVQADL